MMALEVPESGFTWLKIPIDRPVRAVVVGPAHSWWTHWHRPEGSRRQVAVRCVRYEVGSCEWCDRAYDRRVRYVLPVRVGTEERVVELGRVQYPALQLIEALGGLVGAEVEIGREGPYANSPITVRQVGRERVPPEAVVECGGFVSTLGLLESRLALQDAPPPLRPVPEATRNGRRYR